MATKKYFEIDHNTKTFIFGARTYPELFVEDSEVNRAFKAAMALGCYEGYTPVQKPFATKKDRSTAAQSFTEIGAELWIKDNRPEYLARWDIMKDVRKADGGKYAFMVRKNLFLYENQAAREYCGIKPRKDGKPYQLNPLGKALLMAVEARTKQMQEEPGQE